MVINCQLHKLTDKLCQQCSILLILLVAIDKNTVDAPLLMIDLRNMSKSTSRIYCKKIHSLMLYALLCKRPTLPVFAFKPEPYVSLFISGSCTVARVLSASVHRRKYVHQYSLFNNDYPALSTYRHFSMRPIMYSSLVASNWYSSRIEIRKTKRTTNSLSIIVQHASVLIQKKINKYKIAKFTVRIRIFDKSIWYGDGLKMIERNIRTV